MALASKRSPAHEEAAVCAAARRWQRQIEGMASDQARAGCLCDPARYPERGEVAEFSHDPRCAVGLLLSVSRLMVQFAAEAERNAKRGDLV